MVENLQTSNSSLSKNCEKEGDFYVLYAPAAFYLFVSLFLFFVLFFFHLYSAEEVPVGVGRREERYTESLSRRRPRTKRTEGKCDVGRIEDAGYNHVELGYV